MANHVGQHIGSYQLLRSLGEGGFAEVYLGTHLYLKHLAAIKILHAHLAGQDAKQFLAEALTLADLVHPNIVRILDFAVQDGIPFLVMDYVPGGSLRQHHPEGVALPLEQIVLYVKHVASALQYAHGKQVIHRDVKPENMLLTAQGEVVLSDFGIAVVSHRADSLLKQKVAGTPAYMAPELISGRAGAASDQYALAISVYEWLCGEPPFRGSALHIMSQQKNRPVPSLREKVSTIPPAVERVVLKALAKDPQQRFGSIQQFAEALEHAHQQSLVRTTLSLTTTIPLRQAPWRLGKDVIAGKLSPLQKHVTRRDAMIALGGIVMAGGVGWGLAVFLRQRSPASGYHGHSGPVRSVAWSPDGKLVASASDDGTVQVWNPTALQPTLTYRQHTGPVNAVAWSPDGKRIASGSNDSTAQTWDAATGEFLSPRGRPFGTVNAAAWSSDGQYCAVAYDETIQIWARSQGDITLVYTHHSDTVRSLSWSPDSKSIASGDNQGNLHIWDTNTAEKRFSLKRLNALNVVAWSPDGAWIAFGGDGGTVEIMNVATGVNPAICRGTSAVLVAAWSPDSKSLATLDLEENVRIWDTFTGKLLKKYAGRSGRGAQAVPAIGWSPDSTQDRKSV